MFELVSNLRQVISFLWMCLYLESKSKTDLHGPARTTSLWLRRIIKCLRVNFFSNKHVFQRFTSFVGIIIGGLLKLVFSRGWFSIRPYWLLIFYSHQCNTKPREWKHYVDDVFSLWDCNRKDVEFFILFIYFYFYFLTFLDTTVFRGERFIVKSILYIKTRYKLTETFQHTHFTSCHPQGVKRGFINGEAIRLLRTNSSKTTFDECLANFKQRLEARRYPKI